MRSVVDGRCPKGGRDVRAPDAPDGGGVGNSIDAIGVERAACGRMSRQSPRYVPAGYVVEITARTVGGRFLLRPSAELNATILAVLGRALALFPVDLHAVAFMSNHWHALVSVPDARALTQFVQHVHSNIARAANRLCEW